MPNNARILVANHTCWRIARAARATVLIDGAAYFGTLRKALMKAQRSIFIAGWDIDSRLELLGAEPRIDDGAPTKLGDLLRYLVRRRPELRVRLLLWDYSVVYALEREPLPSVNLDWTTPRQIQVCLDDVLPLGACHHQKIVVIDDAVAFCGGLDLTIRRWDSPEHRSFDSRRRDPLGKHYGPFHDVQMCVDGEAASVLADLVRERWLEAACERVQKCRPAGDPWPEKLAADFTDVEVGVARTLPAFGNAQEVREVEALYLAAVGRARRIVYIENQFLTADSVAERLAQRLRANPKLEVLLVSPRTHTGWLEARSMKAGRIRFMKRLEGAGVLDRVRLLYPAVGTGDSEQPVMVHAKLMIVDDVFLRIGSSNLNKRSMGLDTECDLAIEAGDDRQRQAIAALRNRLLGEHLGATADEIAEACADQGSILRAVDARTSAERGLRPVRDGGDYADPISQAVTDLADPERPVEASSYVGDMFGAQPATQVLGRIGKLSLVGLVVLALALIWKFSPLSQFADPERLLPLADEVAANRWTPILMPALYVLAGLVVFPITVLIAVTAMVFEPGSALLYACVGSLGSAVVTYQCGALAGRRLLRDLMGRRLNRISRALAKKGVLSVLTIRLVPVAPFTLINLAAGVSHIGLRDFVLGTFLGMAPGIVLMTALGHRLAQVVEDPSLEGIAFLTFILGLWVAACAGLQVVASRLRRAKRA